MFSLLKQELFKFFIKNYGLLFVCIYAAFSAFSFLASIEDNLSPLMRIHMSGYYEEYGGKLSEETQIAIMQKKETIDQAKVTRDKTFSDYESGLISQSEADKILLELSPLLSEERAFEHFYTQYNHCLQAPETRYLIDTSKWTSLISIGTPDFILIFVTIFFTSLLYKNDTTQGISQVVKPSLWGFSRLLYIKWFCAIIISVLLGIITQSSKLLLIINSNMIKDGSAPLQSIPIYSTSSTSFTLWETFILGSIIRLLGLAYCSMLTACLIVICFSTTLGMFFSSLTILIPYYAGSTDNLYQTYPSPVALVQAFPYLLESTDSEARISIQTLHSTVLSSCLVSLALCLASRQCYIGRKLHRLGKMCTMIIICSVCLSGCSDIKSTSAMHYTSNYSVDVTETQDYLIYRNNGIWVYEKDNKKTYLLLNDPLESSELKTTFSSAKAIDNQLYFMYHDQDHNRTVQVINLDTYERAILYTDVVNEQELTLFGVLLVNNQRNPYIQYMNSIHDFFIIDGSLILIRNETISIVKNGFEKTLYEGYFRNIASNGKDIFFTNDRGILCKIDVPSHKVQQFEDIRPHNLIAHKSKLYYLCPERGNAVISLDLDTQTEVKLFDGSWKSFDINGQWFLLTTLDNELYTACIDSLQLSKIPTSNYFDDAVLLNDGSHIIYVSYAGGSIEYSKHCLHSYIPCE